MNPSQSRRIQKHQKIILMIKLHSSPPQQILLLQKIKADTEHSINLKFHNSSRNFIYAFPRNQTPQPISHQQKQLEFVRKYNLNQQNIKIKPSPQKINNKIQVKKRKSKKRKQFKIQTQQSQSKKMFLQQFKLESQRSCKIRKKVLSQKNVFKKNLSNQKRVSKNRIKVVDYLEPINIKIKKAQNPQNVKEHKLFNLGDLLSNKLNKYQIISSKKKTFKTEQSDNVYIPLKRNKISQSFKHIKGKYYPHYQN